MGRNEVVGFMPAPINYNEVKHKFEEDEKMEQVAVAKPPRARLNPDSIPVLAVAVALVGILMISSFVVSFSGLYDASEWTGLPQNLRWLPALFIDAAILAYTIALIVFKARGESVWRTVLGLAAFAGMSVVANIAHTLSYWDGNLSDFRAWVGVAITASAPIAVLLASEEITRLAFQTSENK